MSETVLIARIGAAHGIKGDVRVKPFGDDPLALGDSDSLTDESRHGLPDRFAASGKGRHAGRPFQGRQ